MKIGKIQIDERRKLSRSPAPTTTLTSKQLPLEFATTGNSRLIGLSSQPPRMRSDGICKEKELRSKKCGCSSLKSKAQRQPKSGSPVNIGKRPQTRTSGPVIAVFEIGSSILPKVTQINKNNRNPELFIFYETTNHKLRKVEKPVKRKIQIILNQTIDLFEFQFIFQIFAPYELM